MSLEDFSICVGHTNLEEHLSLHPGTEPAPRPNDGGEPYTDDAYVPVVKRRLLSASELDAISSDWHWPSSQCISSFKIHDAALSHIKDVSAKRQDKVTKEYLAVGDRLWTSVCEASPISSIGPMQWLGISRRPSGLRTSTLDAHIGRRIGLHLDSWDRAAISHRHASRIRLCINLGTHMRSLLFIPYDIKTIDDAISGTIKSESDHYGNIGHRFCREFRDAPVFELTIPPGFAYLAPTENIIHDGCSEPADGPDMTIAWLGFIVYSASFSV
jgi:hypothetical protein